jgi:ABC-type transport system involved in multi-copper enzyme maturation permease subunit
VRLLGAELRKLRRPLVVWTAFAVVAIVALHAWGIQRNARSMLSGANFGGGPIPTCQQMGLADGSAQCQQVQDQNRRVFCASQNLDLGPQCDQAIAQADAEGRRAFQDFLRQEAAQAREVRALQSPLGVGFLAGGMMASLVGAVAMLLLAGGHIGNEWSGRTIKQVFVQEGQRWRVVLAKFLSLWIIGVFLLIVLWAALAALAPVFAAAYHLSVPPVPATKTLWLSLHVVWRALLVLAAFAALGTLTAAVTRNTLGAFFLGFAFVIASQLLAGYKVIGRWTLAQHVAGWMGFHPSDLVLNHLWRDDFSQVERGSGFFLRVNPWYPSHVVGLIGLLATIALCLAVAWLRIERSDVKV